MRLRFGEWLFDGEARRVWCNDEPLHLTPKAFELLQILIEERPRAVAKKELQNRLWPDVVVEEANVKNLVSEIRKAFGGAPVIRTVHRYGYAFAGREEEVMPPGRLIEGDRVYRLKRGENLIGRDGDVVIDFTGVSRRHAIIRSGDGRWTLEDLGSKNGTFNNDVRVTGSVELQDGDRIRLGALLLVFRSTAPAGTTPTVA